MRCDDAARVLERRDRDDLTSMRHAVALANMMSAELEAGSIDILKRIDEVISCERQIDGRSYSGRPNPSLYKSKPERDLAVALSIARTLAANAMSHGDRDLALQAIAGLRPYVDAFFAEVVVNSSMADLRENRLKLLNEVRSATRTVADFSKITD